MTWTIEFDTGVEKDLKKLDKKAQKKILDYFDKKILTSENPRRFGKALTGSLQGLWRYRVGDYRIICRIEDDILVVLVIGIGHRSKIYK